MKRDMELVRRILLVLEQRGPNDLAPVTPYEASVDEDTLLYHLDLLKEGGLIDGIGVASARNGARRVISWETMRLTWPGHDFIAAAKEPAVWQGAKQQAGNMFASLPLEVIKGLLVEVAKKLLGL